MRNLAPGASRGCTSETPWIGLPDVRVPPRGLELLADEPRRVVLPLRLETLPQPQKATAAARVLGQAGPEDLLVVTHELQEKIRAADLGGRKAGGSVPGEPEKPCNCGCKSGEPMFLFVARETTRKELADFVGQRT